MPIFNAYELNLPTSIWIDGNRSLQHSRRIKFKDSDNTNSRNWATITIDKFNTEIFNLSNRTFLSIQDVEKLKDFVRINYETLIMVAKGKLNNKAEIKSRLTCNDDVSTLMRISDNTINIECSFFKDRIFFIGENNEKTKAFIEKLGNVRPFHHYSKQSTYIDFLELKGNGNQIMGQIKHILHNTAKEMGK